MRVSDMSNKQGSATLLVQTRLPVRVACTDGTSGQLGRTRVVRHAGATNRGGTSASPR
jgi:hypothetical protein